MHRRTIEPVATSSNGRYRIIRPLGQGGMGMVVEAIDTWLHRRVALKFIRGPRGDRSFGLRQLVREAEAMARPNDIRICSVLNLAKHDGRPCLVMERLVGCTLEARIARGNLGTDELVDIASQLAAALDVVHRVGLVHQDIKPANVFVTPSGLIKLLDFGLAMPPGVSPSDSGSPRRARPVVLGTTNYIAPERILRWPVDHRSDLFSLGTVMYEMATGRQPFAGTSPAEVLFNVLDKHPPSIRALMPARPIALERIVRKLLAKSAEHRYRSAADARKALLRIRAGEVGPACARSSPRTQLRAAGPRCPKQ